MSFKYEPKSGIALVEFALPGGELVSIKEGGSYESETQLLGYPKAGLKETKVSAEPKTSKASETTEEGGAS